MKLSEDGGADRGGYVTEIYEIQVKWKWNS